MGDVLNGEFEISTKCEHRIWLAKCTWAKPKPLLQAERARVKGETSFYSCSVRFYEWIDSDESWIGFAMISRSAPWIELQPMCRKAQFMPQAIHESTAFNSRNREVAIHCVFSVKDNTHFIFGFEFMFNYFRLILPPFLLRLFCFP